MKFVSIVGARPQFIKVAPVHKALRDAGHRHILLHTGQHYDTNMSVSFFEDLGIPEPDTNLGVGSGTHAFQTGQMLIGAEQALQEYKPDAVLVYGDTNSTLAGALAAVKLGIRLGHVEAGLRSYNRAMPEEHNRVLVDHCSDMLFCPTQTAVSNLAREGITLNVYWIGDVMYDVALQFTEIANQRSTILRDLSLAPKSYILATIHRPYNTDDPQRMQAIYSSLSRLVDTVIFPVHPRTALRLASAKLVAEKTSCLRIIEPLGYLDMLVLEQNARAIVTDSGGIQKEAYFFAVPCVTIRPETEWPETVQAGWNRLVEPDDDQITEALCDLPWPVGKPANVFGNGRASQRLVEILSTN